MITFRECKTYLLWYWFEFPGYAPVVSGVALQHFLLIAVLKVFTPQANNADLAAQKQYREVNIVMPGSTNNSLLPLSL